MNDEVIVTSRIRSIRSNPYTGVDPTSSAVLASIGFTMYTWFNKDVVDIVFSDIKNAYLEWKNKDYKENRLLVEQKFCDAIANIQSLTKDEITTIYEKIYSDDQQSFQQKIIDLFSKLTPNLIEEEEYYSDGTYVFGNSGKRWSKGSRRSSVPRVVSTNSKLGIFGFFVGAWNGYVYYVLSLEAADWFLKEINYLGDNEAQLAETFASFGSLANGALGAVAVRKRFIQLANIKDYPYIQYSTNRTTRKMVVAGSIICGVSVAAMIMYLTYDFIANQNHGYPYMLVMLIPTLLAPTAIRSEAFEKLMNRFIDYCRSFKKSNALTTEAQKDN